jgi:hypothetical protein
MADAVFNRVAEDRPVRHGTVVPGCCHTCGGHIQTNHRGQDDATGPQYEGRTREACHELDVIKAAGPCSLCTDMEVYLRQEHEGKKNMPARLLKGVPKGHLDKNCPLQGFAWQNAYWTLRKFIKGVAGRLEATMVNIVQENKFNEQAATKRRQNKEARRAQARLLRSDGQLPTVSGTLSIGILPLLVLKEVPHLPPQLVRHLGPCWAHLRLKFPDHKLVV